MSLSNNAESYYRKKEAEFQFRKKRKPQLQKKSLNLTSEKK